MYIYVLYYHTHIVIMMNKIKINSSCYVNIKYMLSYNYIKINYLK